MNGQQVTLEFPYRQAEIGSCRLPADRLGEIYRMQPVKEPADLTAEIERAVRYPIGAAALSRIVRRGGKVALLVDDNTRPTPAALVLPCLLEELRRAGIGRDDISIVMALGSHRFMTGEEIEAKIGPETARAYRVLNSRFDDPDHLSYMGTSEDGVRIFIDEEVARADYRIGVGSIVPHAAVGWSGGGKILYPGAAGRETVAHFHFAHGLTGENMTGRERCAVRERMERWVDIVGLDFVVDCILTPEDRVYRVVAGHYRQAQRRGVALARQVYTRRIREKTEIVIAVSHAHDGDFWQATKGIYSGEPLVRDGGTLLLLTPCPEGLGRHVDFPARIGSDDNRTLMLDILNGKRPLPEDPLPVAPAAMLARLRQRIRCAVVSPGLTAEQMRSAGYEKLPDAQTAVDALLRRYPQGRVSVVMRSDLTFQA